MDIAKIIDYTLVKPQEPLGSYTELCRNAIRYKINTVCVNSFHVPLVSNLLHSYIHTDMNLDIKIASTIGFPFGTSSIESKVEEMKQAFNDGATEFDFVLNLSAAKTHDWLRIQHEFESLRKTIPTWLNYFHPTLKVILEVGMLTDDEIKKASELAIETGMDFLKTSTGINVELAPIKTAEYVKMLKDFSKGSKIKVKASGYIKTLQDFNMMLEAGADRIGVSRAVQILDELLNNGQTQR